MRLPTLLLLALTLSTAGAAAQTVSPGAYAPDDLSVLKESDQVRVISREYFDQSRGRTIPGDQLEFYLDQIDSGWRFGDIRSDIARSLRGERPGAGGGWQDGDGDPSRIVRCESIDERHGECRTGFHGRAELVKQLSRAQCIEGRSWGQRPGTVWVDHGCRAEFAETRGWSADPNYTVSCSSHQEMYATCRWDTRLGGRPKVVERFSREECFEGRTWGWRGDVIWVDDGCRARFGPSGYER
jgi:hypothetical protein